VARFVTFLGAKADRALSIIQSADIVRFRDAEATARSRSSANLVVKVLRVMFNSAYKQGIIGKNAASMVDKLKERGESKRRPFTVAEIERVLSVTGDSEWRGMVLFGLYTGQCLGDLSRLTWRAVNLDERTIAFTTRKTGRRMVLPSAKPLQNYLTSMPSSDDPNDHLFPTLARRKGGALSAAFYDVLAEAGLVEPRTHKATGKGRHAARPVSELSFHSLRHTATTMLKAAGASDVLAREIIGHDSAVVSRGYTHLGTEDLRESINRLPDVTREATAEGRR
jgi:integrase